VGDSAVEQQYIHPTSIAPQSVGGSLREDLRVFTEGKAIFESIIEDRIEDILEVFEAIFKDDGVESIIEDRIEDITEDTTSAGNQLFLPYPPI
jgi:hypothetical protein